MRMMKIMKRVETGYIIMSDPDDIDWEKLKKLIEIITE